MPSAKELGRNPSFPSRTMEQDGALFTAAIAAGWLLRPRKWVENSPGSIGLSAPLPDQAGIDLKGSWVSDADSDYRQDPCKQDRDKWLSDRGFV